jgi:hypothetical protein
MRKNMRHLYSRKGSYNRFGPSASTSHILSAYALYARNQKRMQNGDCFSLDSGFLFREDIWMSKIMKAMYA